MTALAISDVRELTMEETDEVNGAWVANAVGAGIGALGGGVTGFISSGGSWRSAGAGPWQAA